MHQNIASTLKKPAIAVLDFDGTLTFGDTLLPFLARVSLLKLLLGLIVALPAIGAFFFSSGLLKRMTLREQAKQLLCSTVLRGCRREDLVSLASRWVPSIRFRSKMLIRLQWHKTQGHKVAIASASPDIYMEEVARQLGIDALFCTCMETDVEGRLTGRFSTPNCWGPEKLNRLQTCFGAIGDYELFAYGDSTGDLWLIEAADHAWFKGHDIGRHHKESQ
jgi:phosphatidylglycerophosphatase C